MTHSGFRFPGRAADFLAVSASPVVGFVTSGTPATRFSRYIEPVGTRAERAIGFLAVINLVGWSAVTGTILRMWI